MATSLDMLKAGTSLAPGESPQAGTAAAQPYSPGKRDSNLFGTIQLTKQTENVAEYQFYVVCNQKKVFVQGYLPEEFQMDTQSEYEAPFAQGLLGEKLGMLAQFFGVRPTTQSMTTEMWKGSTPIELSIPIVLVAENSDEDVTGKIVSLMSLVVPTQTDLGFLEAPGPSFGFTDTEEGKKNEAETRALAQTAVTEAQAKQANLSSPPDTGASDSNIVTRTLNSGQAMLSKYFEYKNPISVHIGRFLRFKSVVITNVSQSYAVVLSKTGVPMKATVTVTFRTSNTPTLGDVREMFGYTREIQ